MRVQAAPGLKVPREDDPRAYITEDQPVEIEMTGYYIRRMSAGELVEVPGGAPADPTKAASSSSKTTAAKS